MGAPNEHIDSPFDDEIRRDPLAGGRASHRGHAAHGGEHAPTERAMEPTPAPFANAPLCSFCGYELTGMDVGGNCPECGKPIWESNLLPKTTSGLAIASMVCGIVSIPSCIMFGFPSFVLGLLAVVFGMVAGRDIRRGKFSPVSRSYALSGQICGWVGIALSVGWWVLVTIV